MARIRHMTDINNVADMEELAEWMRTKKVKNWSDNEKTQLELAARKLFVSLEGKSPLTEKRLLDAAPYDVYMWAKTLKVKDKNSGMMREALKRQIKK